MQGQIGACSIMCERAGRAGVGGGQAMWARWWEKLMKAGAFQKFKQGQTLFGRLLCCKTRLEKVSSFRVVALWRTLWHHNCCVGRDVAGDEAVLSAIFLHQPCLQEAADQEVGFRCPVRNK